MANSDKINVDVSTLKIGQNYFRDYLAKLWHYNGQQGLQKGIIPVSGTNIILLFTTKEKTKDATQYKDYCENGKLVIDGQIKHRTDEKVFDPMTKFYSFYREKKKIKNESVPFTYQGEVRLIREKCIKRPPGDAPSTFFFEIIADKNDDKIAEEIDNILEMQSQKCPKVLKRL